MEITVRVSGQTAYQNRFVWIFILEGMPLPFVSSRTNKLRMGMFLICPLPHVVNHSNLRRDTFAIDSMIWRISKNSGLDPSPLQAHRARHQLTHAQRFLRGARLLQG